MSWNIFKRVAQLEQQVKDLTDFNSDNSRWICRLQDKVRHIENKLFIQAVEHKAFSAAPVHSEGEPVFTKDEVDQEKERKRQYQREWYAKNKSKAAREKKNAYHRAYYARKKGATNA
jgi:phosphoribosylformylglycinamidine (FGAM) synthase-like amidotransferase family enzyme